MNLKDKSILVKDHGLFFPLAQRLASDFGKVGYAPEWRKGFPSYQEYDVGRGFDEVEHVENFWKVVDNYDLIVFPDILDGDLQVHLQKEGHRVFGSRLGEELELYRFYSKKMLEAVGLPVQPYRLIVGMDALREYLMEHDNKFVKFSLLRGISETFHHQEYWMSEPRLDELEHTLGIRKHKQEFIVEDPVETNLEYGYDGLSIDGQWPKQAMLGIERKDECLVGAVMDYRDLPDGLLEVNRKIAPVLAQYQYRNFFSTEIRESKDGKPYMIDFCCRQPCPSGEAQQELWGNLSEMIWEGAGGKLIQPEPTARFAVESIIYGDRADDNWQPIEIPDKYRANVKLFFHTRVNGHDYVIPQQTKMNECGAVVTVGDNLEQTVAENEAISKLIKGDKIEVRTKAIPDAIAEFEEMAKKGLIAA